MSTKREKQATVGVKSYKGIQLLRMVKYDNRIARIVIKPEEVYTFAEADALIEKYKKKG